MASSFELKSECNCLYFNFFSRILTTIPWEVKVMEREERLKDPIDARRE